ncbi:hypothetical protein AGMMS50249_1000 [candidate division SR1 bacterium]|nr:hypothetical protein AGMMS50249_1000 [candidate division SR1 bacterium]
MLKHIKKIPLKKKENERTKKEKLCRDVAFFGLVAFAAIVGYQIFDTQVQAVENESYLVSMNVY